MAEILIVEDEFSINELIRKNLKLTGHNCVQVFDGYTAVEMLKSRTFDLIVLDVMLPGIDGYHVFNWTGGTPTIFLTAKSELSDKLKGLTMGADDYMTKPFQMLELAARVETVLRRTKKTERGFVLGDMRVDFESCQAFVKEVPVELSGDTILRAARVPWTSTFRGSARSFVWKDRLKRSISWGTDWRPRDEKTDFFRDASAVSFVFQRHAFDDFHGFASG